MPAYRAACFHGPKGYDALARLTTPAVFVASEEDMLYPHLDRLPPLRDGQRVLRLPHDPTAKLAAIVDAVRSLPNGMPVAREPWRQPAGHDPALQFVDADGMQMLVRCFGDPSAPAIVLLHDAPGSGLAFEATARAIAGLGHYVILPDLPGCGESGYPGGSILQAAAKAVSVVIDTLEIDRFSVAAMGCGVAVGAHIRDRRLTELFIDDVWHVDPSAADRIAPDLPLAPEGTHWLTAWLMIRDGQIYRPWFDGRVSAQRDTQGNFDAQWLHDQTVEIMKARETYCHLPREACMFDSAAALADAQVPVRQGNLTFLIANHGVFA